VTWQRSRDPNFKLSVEEVARLVAGHRDKVQFRSPGLRQDAEELTKEVDRVWEAVIHDHLPIAETIHFTFWLDDVPIRLREQIVRHRIGQRHGEALGVDVVPDLADSTFWAMSMRALDMGEFADRGDYFIPDSIEKDPSAKRVYVDLMRIIEETYVDLTKSFKIPNEDAAAVLPLAVTSGTSWTINLAALKHVIGKRSCWILQGGLWAGLIKGMVHELAEKVDPSFIHLINPPCIRGRDTWTGCKFMEDNRRRIMGDDPLPPCSLFVNKHFPEVREIIDRNPDKTKGWGWREGSLGTRIDNPEKSMEEAFEKQKEIRRDLWRRDPETGNPLT